MVTLDLSDLPVLPDLLDIIVHRVMRDHLENLVFSALEDHPVTMVPRDHWAWGQFLCFQDFIQLWNDSRFVRQIRSASDRTKRKLHINSVQGREKRINYFIKNLFPNFIYYCILVLENHKRTLGSLTLLIFKLNVEGFPGFLLIVKGRQVKCRSEGSYSKDIQI